MIALRKKEIVPRLEGMNGNSGRFELIAERAVRVTWIMGDGAELSLVANLSPEPIEGIEIWGKDQLWLEGSAEGDRLGGWSAVFTLRDEA